MARVVAVRNIWEKEWKEKQNTIPNVVIPRLISFSLGFLAGAEGHGWIFWVFSLFLYFVFFYAIKHFIKVYKINI